MSDNEIKQEAKLSPIQEAIEKNSWVTTPLSSNISRIRYIKEASLLIIQFKSGQHYRYDKISEGLVVDFYASPSKGKFFLSRIKGGYTGTKCDDNGEILKSF